MLKHTAKPKSFSHIKGATLPELAVVMVITAILMAIVFKGFVVTGESKLDDLEKNLLQKVYSEANGKVEIDSLFVSPIKSSEVPDEPNATCGWYPGLIPENSKDPKVVYCINSLLIQKPASYYDPGSLIKNGELKPSRLDGFNICYLLIDVQKSKSYPMLNGVPYAISFRLMDPNRSSKDNYLAAGNGELFANFDCHGKLSEIAGYVKAINALKDIVEVHGINITHELFSQNTLMIKWMFHKVDILIGMFSITTKMLGLTRNILTTVDSLAQVIEGIPNTAPTPLVLIPIIQQLTVTLPRGIQGLVDALISLEKKVAKLQDEPGEMAAAQEKVDRAKSNKDKAVETKRSYLNYIESMHNKGVWL